MIAFLFRMIALNQSLWLDEATTAKVVQSFSFTDIIKTFSPTDFHPPLYYLFMKLWGVFFVTSETALRFPSVLLSILTGYVVYKIGRLLKNEATGLYGAILFLFNPLIIYYSQEARMYMMAVFFIAASFYFFLSFLKKSHPRSFYLHILFSTFAFFTFYGSAFFIASSIVYLIIKRKYKEAFLSAAGIIISLAILFPLLLKQYINAKQSLSLSPNWSQVLGKATLKNLFLIPLKFSVGRISFEPKLIYYLVSGLWSLFLFSMVMVGAQKERRLLFFLVFPIVTGAIASFFTPLLSYFRFLYLIIFMSLLLSLSAKNKFIKALIVSGFLVFSFSYLFIPSFHRENWEELARRIPKDKQVFMILSSSDPLRYYSPKLKVLDLRLIEYERSLEKEILVIPYTADIHGVNYQESLQKMGYSLKKKVTFRGVIYEVWTLNAPDFQKAVFDIQ